MWPARTETSTQPVVTCSFIRRNKRPIKKNNAKAIARIMATVGILVSVRDKSVQIHCDPANGPDPFGVTTLSGVMPMSPIVSRNCWMMGGTAVLGDGRLAGLAVLVRFAAQTQLFPCDNADIPLSVFHWRQNRWRRIRFCRCNVGRGR